VSESGKWRLQQVNHINAIVDGWEASIEHFRDRIGFTLDMRIPDEGQGDGTDACLMSLGGVMFEFFAPKERSERGQGRLLDRYGDHYIGIEYEVPDVTEARRVCEQRDVRIINDRDSFFFTYPGSSFGVSFELVASTFNALAQPVAYWRDEHPLALTGLARLSVAVRNVDDAVNRFQELAGVPQIGEVTRRPAAARGVSVQVGDAVWEFLEPTGDGPVADYLERYGERIRSTVFRTKDISKVQNHLSAQGFDLIQGDADGAVAIDPAQNKNLLFEFTE
jgi:catechol 2,3-dioxygenase-like lactoylglutathione lyase family enzyme